jgi:hypothetical protein
MSFHYPQSFPLDVAVDDSGNIYIADYKNNHIRKVSPDGIITTIAGDALQATQVMVARQSEHQLRVRRRWRWTARATFMWPTRATTRSVFCGPISTRCQAPRD